MRLNGSNLLSWSAQGHGGPQLFAGIIFYMPLVAQLVRHKGILRPDDSLRGPDKRGSPSSHEAYTLEDGP
jgi:hypothetical protein